MHAKLKELRAKLAKLRSEGRANVAELKKLETQIAALTAEADAAKKAELQAKYDALAKETDKDADAAIALQDSIDDVERRIHRETAFSEGRASGRRIENVDNGYEATFGFRNLADFAMAVRAATPGGGVVVVDERLTAMATTLEAMRQNAAPTNYHQERGGSADEGYMVPAEMREGIWELVFQEPDIFNMMGPQPTSRNSIQTYADETTPWGSSGILAYWAAEAAQLTASKLATKAKLLELYKLFCFVLATDELLEDAANLNDRLTRGAARAIAWKASDAVIYGTGAGQLTGYFNHAATITQAKTSAQATGTFSVTNAADMMSRLLNPMNGRFLLSPQLLSQVVGMTIGNNAAYVPINQGAQKSPFNGYLLGLPVQFTQHAKAKGILGDVQLVDPDGYMAARRAQGMQFDSSIHLYFDYGIQAFRWTVRLGGRPVLSAAVNPANGTDTLGHTVLLEARP